MNTPEKRLEVYAQAPETVRELYGSDILGDALKAVSNKLQSQYGNFVDLIGDVILGLEKPESVYTTLTTRFNLAPDIANEIITSIVMRLNNPLLQIPRGGGVPLKPRTPVPMPQPPVTPPSFTPPSTPRAPVVDTPFYGPPVKAPEANPVPAAPIMPKAPSAPLAPTPAFQAPVSTIPTVRVMPQSKEEAKEAEHRTELPNSLLKNLQSALAHGEGDHAPEEQTAPKTSYNSLLNNTPPPKPPLS